MVSILNQIVSNIKFKKLMKILVSVKIHFNLDSFIKNIKNGKDEISNQFFIKSRNSRPKVVQKFKKF